VVNIISKNYLFENIQLVIFDKDGTITDINKYWSYVISQRANYFGEKYKNLDLKNEIRISLGLTSEKVISKESPIGKKSRDEIVSLIFQVVNNYHNCSMSEILEGFSYVDSLVEKNINLITSLLPGVKKFIKTLKENNCIITLATQDTSKNAIYNLDYLRIGHCFDKVIGSELVKKAKPDPEMGYKILEGYPTISPENILVIGDSLVDLHFANNLNTNFLGVNTGVQGSFDSEKSISLVKNLQFIEVI